MAHFKNNFIEMFLEQPSKISKIVLFHLTKWPPELKQGKPKIGISHSTDAITVMANLGLGEQSRAIMALLFFTPSI